MTFSIVRPLLCAAVLAIPSGASSRPRPVVSAPHVVTVDPIVRALLAALWDDSTATQPERAYCVAYVVGRAWGVPAYRVWAIAPAVIEDADPYHVVARCPVGPNVALVHTHPPATCDDVTRVCVIGGDDAWECFASDTDERMLRASGDPFTLIQCSRHAIITVYPTPTTPGR